MRVCVSSLLLLLSKSSAFFTPVPTKHGLSKAFISTSPSTFSQPKRLFAAPTENEEDDAKDSDEAIESSTNSTEIAHQKIEEYKANIAKKGASMNKLKKEMKITMKFGGSSLASAARVDEVARIIKGQIEYGYRPIAVICSAMGKTTNTLLSAGDIALQGRVDIDALRTLHMATIDEFDLPEHVRKDVTKLLDECEGLLNGVSLLTELSPRSLDKLVSYGERCSVRIVAARLNQIGVPAQAFDAWEVGILTDSKFGDASLLEESEEMIKSKFSDKIDSNIVSVVTGFIAHDKEGRITTMGRGGSDLTATAIGAACGLDEIQVWKDVDGILSTDPRIVPHAVPVPDVSFEEARELAVFGAQVLHPIAMQPAMKRDVPVRVKNSYNPPAPGTLIHQRSRPERLVTAITCKRGVHLLDIESTRMLGAYGFLSTVFEAFERNKLSVDVLASSEVSISLTLDKKQKLENEDKLIEELKPCADVTVKKDKAILTLIADVERSSDVLATAFRIFSARGINVEMMSQGASKVNISFVLDNSILEDAITHLHSCFFEDLCIVDTDLVGDELINKPEPAAQAA